MPAFNNFIKSIMPYMTEQEIAQAYMDVQDDIKEELTETLYKLLAPTKDDIRKVLDNYLIDMKAIKDDSQR